ncbi:hypothetical protein Cni_G21607 [Canna indica]|uniref:Uncharacterized protein n=1 Tax=Canna indica TaxID=4628 RepID=A0AAQ3QIV0_9LILI|nr:hypothetical protein Cni_G21607 [Canna indica]
MTPRPPCHVVDDVGPSRACSLTTLCQRGCVIDDARPMRWRGWVIDDFGALGHVVDNDDAKPMRWHGWVIDDFGTLGHVVDDDGLGRLHALHLPDIVNDAAYLAWHNIVDNATWKAYIF